MTPGGLEVPKPVAVIIDTAIKPLGGETKEQLKQELEDKKHQIKQMFEIGKNIGHYTRNEGQRREWSQVMFQPASLFNERSAEMDKLEDDEEGDK